MSLSTLINPKQRPADTAGRCNEHTAQTANLLTREHCLKQVALSGVL